MPLEPRGPGQWRARHAHQSAHCGRRMLVKTSASSRGANLVATKGCGPTLNVASHHGKAPRGKLLSPTGPGKSRRPG